MTSPYLTRKRKELLILDTARLVVEPAAAKMDRP